MKLLRLGCGRRSLPLYLGVFLVCIPVFTILSGRDKPWNDGEGSISSRSSGGSHFESSNRHPDVELSLAQKIVELREQLKHVESMNQATSMELAELRKHAIGSQPSNVSGNLRPPIADNLLRMPSISRYMPHFSNAVYPPLKPAFRRIGASLEPNGRQGMSMVFGLPTVKRDFESYLLLTLRNLIENMSAEERAECVIIVLIAELDSDWVELTATKIESEFGAYIDGGLLELIAPSSAYYPDLERLGTTLGDTSERTRWRTKQNLDYSYLMMYAEPKGTFYVQLEDDIITKPGFVSRMKQYALKQIALKKEWMIIDFCSLGFIGKMIKSVDLSTLVLFFIMFQRDKPVDWLLNYIVITRYCRMDKDTKDCRKVISKHWLQHRPSLFQHIGTHSSLKGKIQKLRDRQFGQINNFKPHADNPTAIATTTIKHFKKFSIQKAYDGVAMFWGMEPKAGDSISFQFTPPVRLESYMFRSANLEHQNDKLLNASIEMDVISTGSDESELVPIGEFKGDQGTASALLSSSLGPIKCLTIRLHADLKNWIILSEIKIKQLQQGKIKS